MRIVLLLLYLAVVATVLTVGADGTPRAILKGWGDTAYHLDIIGTLAARTLHPTNPALAGEPLAYPFFIDFVSALLRKAGLSVFAAFQIPAIAFGIVLFAAFWLLGKRMLGRNVLAIAFVAIVLFGGGLGFVQFFGDVAAGASFSHEYTHLDDRTGGKPAEMDAPLNIVWIVPAISFFSHQRSFIPGAALGAFVLWGLFSGGKNRWKWLIAAGFLPWIHTHTFLAFAMILPVVLLFEIREWRQWLPWGLAAVAIALPQVWYLLGRTSRGSFFVWAPGWLAAGYENAVWFWTKNFGIVFWGWVITLLAIISGRQARVRPLAAASVAVFAVSNLVQFQPWPFDNNKVIFWWWLMAVVLILAAVGKLMSGRRRLGIVVLAGVVAVGTLAGFLDVGARLVRFREMSYGFYGMREVEAAEWIRANTAPSDIFLTDDQANNFVPMLAGRPVYLGFPGWLWTQGRWNAVSARQEAIGMFFATGNPGTLCRDDVRYIVWDAGLTASYPDANRETIAPFVEPVFSQGESFGGREIFKLKCGEI